MAKKNFLAQTWQRFKKFYNASAENRIGFYTFLGFFIIPAIGMIVFYILVMIFWVK